MLRGFLHQVHQNGESGCQRGVQFLPSEDALCDSVPTNEAGVFLPKSPLVTIRTCRVIFQNRSVIRPRSREDQGCSGPRAGFPWQAYPVVTPVTSSSCDSPRPLVGFWQARSTHGEQNDKLITGLRVINSSRNTPPHPRLNGRFL